MVAEHADELVINDKHYAVTQDARKKCLIVDSERKLVIFLYDYALWEQRDEIKSAFVCGSFNMWLENPLYEMQAAPSLALHYLAVDFSNLSGVGNSGFPEYKFCVNGNFLVLEQRDFIPPGYVFPSADKNLVVLFSEKHLAEFLEECKIADKVKKLSDFDLTGREGQEEISNFRLVPRTKKLFRSFHPFYSTGGRSTKYETEKTRIELVQKLSEQEGIMSDINLTDDYTVFAGEEIKWYDGTEGHVEIPPYYKKILDSKSVCNVMSPSHVVPSYEYVYTHPRDKLFSEWVRAIVTFIIDDAHKAPFQIHCAIGTDRTGVFSALLAAFCGATWEEVSEDYQKTNRMGINEYRSKALLAQSFQRLLSIKDVSKIKNLQAVLWDYFTTTEVDGEPVLTKAQLEALVAKLN